MVLEFSQYLEKYLWPNYKPDSSIAHIMSIVIMVNEKFRERVQVWQVRPVFFASFYPPYIKHNFRRSAKITTSFPISSKEYWNPA